MTCLTMEFIQVESNYRGEVMEEGLRKGINRKSSGSFVTHKNKDKFISIGIINNFKGVI